MEIAGYLAEVLETPTAKNSHQGIFKKIDPNFGGFLPQKGVKFSRIGCEPK